jgi:hypothetical protein
MSPSRSGRSAATAARPGALPGRSQGLGEGGGVGIVRGDAVGQEVDQLVGVGLEVVVLAEGHGGRVGEVVVLGVLVGRRADRRPGGDGGAVVGVVPVLGQRPGAGEPGEQVAAVQGGAALGDAGRGQDRRQDVDVGDQAVVDRPGRDPTRPAEQERHLHRLAVGQELLGGLVLAQQEAVVAGEHD